MLCFIKGIFVQQCCQGVIPYAVPIGCYEILMIQQAIVCCNNERLFSANVKFLARRELQSSTCSSESSTPITSGAWKLGVVNNGSG